jgi:hypothetical protein
MGFGQDGGDALPRVDVGGTVPDSFLRYRFENVDQVRRHFHVHGDRVWFFYPSNEPLLGEKSRVALEVGFHGSDQVCTIHGLARVGEERASGVWLEFTSPGVIRSLEEAVHWPKRRLRRVATNLLVNVSRAPTVAHLARLVDVSVGSARLGDTSVSEGDHVWLRVLGAVPQMPGELGPARVTWTRPGEAGVRFLNSAMARAIIMGVVQRAEDLWESTRAVSHALTCQCRSTGMVHEPRLLSPAVQSAPAS